MNWGRVFFGGVVLSIGIILLLGNAELIDTGYAFSIWWTFVIMFAGVLSFLANPRHWVVAAILVVIGIVFLLARLDLIDAIDLIFPAILIVIGIFVLVGRGLGGKEVAADEVNSFNVFSGSELTSVSPSFKGGSVTAVFGGADIDLRQAGLAPGARLDIFVAFGGVELKVPSSWHVVVKGLPIFGGFENKAASAPTEGAPRLEVSATALFGGVEIKRA
ncbi:MAG TPA: hypothetical protein VF246_09305 [Acidimicrobiia bacterium]